MTIILEQPQPKESFLLIKKENIHPGDRVIFQNQENGKLLESEVLLTAVNDGKGLMKSWKIISWRDAE